VRRLAPLVLIAATSLGAFYEWGGAGYRGMRALEERRYREAAAAFREARSEHPRSAAVRYDEALPFRQPARRIRPRHSTKRRPDRPISKETAREPARRTTGATWR
jgi:hypothetical protein